MASSNCVICRCFSRPACLIGCDRRRVALLGRIDGVSRYAAGTMKNLVFGLLGCVAGVSCLAQGTGEAKHAVVLHAARMLDVSSGSLLTPGEVLVEGER